MRNEHGETRAMGGGQEEILRTRVRIKDSGQYAYTEQRAH